MKIQIKGAIKEELFFFKKILQEKYGLSFYYRYFKNRFLGRFLLPGTSPFICNRNEYFELHALSQKKDIWSLFWALKSFLYHSGLCPKIIIHDDGSIDEKTANILKEKFNNLEILFKKQADEIIQNQFELPDLVLSYRQKGHKLILKLVDIFLLSNGKKVMLLDSDVLFFRRPLEVIDFIQNKVEYDALVSGQNGTYNLMVNEEYAKSYDLIRRKAGFINSGLVVFNKDKIRQESLIEYFENTQRQPSDYWVEMSGWGSLLAQTNFKFLPIDHYIIKGKPKEDTVTKHFTKPRRHELFGYGIDMVRRSIKT